MKRLLFLLLLVPQFTFAAYAVPLSATTTSGTILSFPNKVNSIYPVLMAPSFFASSTATSSFKGGLLLNGAEIGSSTTLFLTDVNRTDPYSQNGSYLSPYKSLLATTGRTWPGAAGYAYNLAPGTYVEGPPFTFGVTPFVLYGNESTIVFASGATFQGPYDIYDATIVSNGTVLHQSDTAITTIHQMTNGVVSTGGQLLQLDGNATLAGMTLAPSTLLSISNGALENTTGSALFGGVNNFGAANFNNVFLQYGTTTAVMNATTTGWLANGIFGNLNINGMTLIATGTGGAINVSNGATSTYNNISNMFILTGGAGVTAGTSATTYCDITALSLTGAMVPPTGSNFKPCTSDKILAWENISVASTTPGTPLSVNGAGVFTGTVTAPIFFATSTILASTFPYASTTALSSSNLVSGNCVQASTGGLLTTTGSACGSGGGSVGNWFTPTLYSNVTVNATSTGLWLKATSPFSLMASSTFFSYASTTNLEMTLYANEYAGSDIGAKINTAYAALPSTGGIIIVPAGAYSFSTQISFSTADKPVLLQCAVDGATTMTYTGTATSTIFNYGGESVTARGHFAPGINNCTLVGPGQSGRVPGVQVGGSNGAEGFLSNGLHIKGFGFGLYTDDNTWLERFVDTWLDNNGVNFMSKYIANNAGEEVSFTHLLAESIGTFVTKCINIQHSSMTSLTFDVSSFDDCGVYISDGNISVNFTNPHFENPGTDSDSTYDFIDIANESNPFHAYTNVHLINPTFILDNQTAFPSEYILNEGANLTIINASVWSSDKTPASFVRQTSTDANTTFNNMESATSSFTSLLNTSSPLRSQDGFDFFSNKGNTTSFGFTASTTNKFYLYASTTPAITINADGTVTINQAAGSGTRCAQFAADGTLSANASACGSGGGLSSYDAWTHPTYGGVLASATTTKTVMFVDTATASSSAGNAQIGALTASTSITNKSVTAALVLNSSTGLEGAYAGASSCGANNFFTGLSATGASTCGTAAISGVNLGSNLNSLSKSGTTLNGTSYNGSATVSDWSLNLANANIWTALQSSAAAGTTTNAGGVEAAGLGTPWINATSTSASSTFAYSVYLALGGGVVSIASSTPWGLLSINPNGIGARPEFVIGSSTKTDFVVTNQGYVGIATTTPFALLSIFAASTSKAQTIFSVSSTTADTSTTTLFSISNVGNTTIGAGFATSTQLPLSVTATHALGGIGGYVMYMGDTVVPNSNPVTYSYKSGSSAGALAVLGFNSFINAAGGSQVVNSIANGWQWKTDIRDAAGSNNSPMSFHAINIDTTDVSIFQLQQNGEINLGGTAPSAPATCGTSPTIRTGSSDAGGTLRVGQGAVSACTLTFAGTWQNQPKCFLNMELSAATATVIVASTTVTTMKISASASNLGGTNIDYWCFSN